jgi:PTH1 family peptidyl-tRNA hydrolase
MLADALVGAWDLGPFRRDGSVRVSRGTVEGRSVRLIKPLAYMNRSGPALRLLLGDADFDPAHDLLVLVDEAALPLGSFRLRARGSHGGHRGLESVELALGTREYARLRIGVGPQPPAEPLEAYVLERFARDELEVLRDLLPELCQAVTCWVTEGIEVAMNRFNRRRRPAG